MEVRAGTHIERRYVFVDGKAILTCHNWMRDHVHHMKAFRHWECKLGSFLDFVIDHQRGDGQFYELFKQMDDTHWLFVDKSNYVLFPEDHQSLVRLEIEADVEYLVFNRENWIVVTNAATFSRVTTGYGKSSFAASTSVKASIAQTFTTVQTATIFASNGMSEWQKAAMRFKRARVMCRDYVVADMVPMKRRSDGKVGVYDLRRRLFLSNAAEEGPDFYEEGVSKFVEYLETDGATISANNDNPGEAILLDYIPASNSVVKAKVMMRGDDRQGAIFCCRNDASLASFTLFYIPSAGGFRWDYNDVIAQYASVGSDVIRNLTASNTGLYVGETRVLSKTPANYMPANRLMLFASYQATLPKVPKPTSNYAKCRLYSFMVYDGDDLSVDLHPCLNKEGEPGLYDNVSGRIYYNIVSGTRFTPSDKEVSAPWQKALIIILR